MNEETLPVELQELIPVINPNRNYWLVRTSSGSNYDTFVEYGFIGIGWNEVPLSEINEYHLNPNNLEIRDSIRSRIVPHNESAAGEENALSSSYKSKALSQIMRFVYEIKKGDIVVIPSYNSDNLFFGEVLDTVLWQATDLDYATDNCMFEKRKRVQWMKEISRNRLEPALYKFIFAHQTINNVDDYSEYINNLLFDFYSIEKNATLVLRIRNDNAIDAFEIGTLYHDILVFIHEFSDFNNQELDTNSVSVKFNLQSPGTIVFIGFAILAFAAIAIMTVFAGGKSGLEYDPVTNKFKFTFKSNSFFDKLSQFLNEKEDRLDRKLARQERTLRLMEGLRKFDVEENKTMKNLTEPEE